MIRNVLGSVVALLGAAAAVQSPFHDWYDGRLGRDYRIQDLFNGIGNTASAVMGSILLPFLFAAVVALAGVLLRSRWVVGLAGLIVLGFTVLWMVRQGQAAGGLAVDSDGSGLGVGVACAAGGGLLLLLGALLMSGRPGPGGHRAGGRRVDRTDREPYPVPGDEHPDTWPPTQEPGPSVQTSPGPEPERYPYTGPEPRHDGPDSRYGSPDSRYDRPDSGYDDTAQYPAHDAQDANPPDQRRRPHP